jgi:DeoR/GlpR family transcriptional regulator of sugar metabolism
MINKNHVLNYIKEKQYITINQMCSDFSISSSTARRTVIQLEKMGKIGRVHGGAFVLQRSQQTLITTRLGINTEKKIKIAKAAAKLVKEDSTIILLSGSSVSFMCAYIKNIDLTVITNSLLVHDELKECPNIRLIILGGLYNHEEAETGGILENASLGPLRADILFMGCSGFDEKTGFTNRNYSVELYRACIQNCNKVCILVDSSKYNKGGTSIAATPEQVNYLFTDNDLPKDAVNHFEQKGITVVLD